MRISHMAACSVGYLFARLLLTRKKEGDCMQTHAAAAREGSCDQRNVGCE